MIFLAAGLILIALWSQKKTVFVPGVLFHYGLVQCSLVPGHRFCPYYCQGDIDQFFIASDGCTSFRMD